MTRRMIDKDQTNGFPGYLNGLARAKAGDKDLQRQLLEAGKDADVHMNRLSRRRLSRQRSNQRHLPNKLDRSKNRWFPPAGSFHYQLNSNRFEQT